MVNRTNVKFSDEAVCGDAVITDENGKIKIFYSAGIILGEEYLVGKFRFIRDDSGDRKMKPLKQHPNASEFYGNYKKIEPIKKKRGFPLDLLNMGNLIGVLKGRDTFEFHAQRNSFEKILAREFPGIIFSEVGSSNVGLNCPKSDIDIYVQDDYRNVTKSIMESHKKYGFELNRGKLEVEVARHRADYGLSDCDARKICRKKLSGLEFAGRVVEFFDNKINPSLVHMFQEKVYSPFIEEGKITEDNFSGHSFVTYGLRSTTIILLRGLYKKKKRHVVAVGDNVRVTGNLINLNPNVVLAEDMTILFS